MNVFEELMNNRWIVKAKDKERYYRVKDHLAEIRAFVTEKLGYRLIVNPYIIKLEKIPGEAKPWMGIGEFTDPEDYSYLCLVLMFLEDREAEEEFVLSQLTEYIAGNFPDRGVDWTVFSNRRKLVRVMKFCLKNGLLVVEEGNEDAFSQDAESEILFENTGLSRYFMRNFSRDISGFTRPSDFYASDWVDMEEERGIVRRQRVYRKLLLSLGMYRKEKVDEDFAYLKNFRNMIEGDFGDLTDCSLQVYHSSAYLIVGPEGELGRLFPGANSLSDAILLFNGMIVEAVSAGELMIDEREMIHLAYQELELWGERCHEKYEHGFPKLYREMDRREFADRLIDEMERLDLLDIDEMTGMTVLYPTAGRVTGAYPEKFSAEGEGNGSE